MIVIKTVRLWVKSWFFDVESKKEYLCSKNLFNKWLDEQATQTNISISLVEVIKVWVTDKLEHYENFWVNYIRLMVPGMEQRTTSIGEAMHHSMKSGFDCVQSSMSLDKSAISQINKAQRKAKISQKKNAEQVARNQTWTSTLTQKYLTDHCAGLVENELFLALLYKVVQISVDLFLVYLPDDKVPCK